MEASLGQMHEQNAALQAQVMALEAALMSAHMHSQQQAPLLLQGGLPMAVAAPMMLMPQQGAGQEMVQQLPLQLPQQQQQQQLPVQQLLPAGALPPQAVPLQQVPMQYPALSPQQTAMSQQSLEPPLPPPTHQQMQKQQQQQLALPLAGPQQAAAGLQGAYYAAKQREGRGSEAGTSNMSPSDAPGSVSRPEALHRSRVAALQAFVLENNLREPIMAGGNKSGVAGCAGDACHCLGCMLRLPFVC